MNINMNKVAELLDASKAIEIDFAPYGEYKGCYVRAALSFTKEEIVEKAAKAHIFSIGDVTFTQEKGILIENIKEEHKRYVCLWDAVNNDGDFHIINLMTGKKRSMTNLDEEDFKHVARFME
jgi:hypothetical protein